MANIKKLREIVKDELTPYYDTDFNLLRWLQGHNNNFEEIVPKLKNHLAMRKSNFQLDTIADGPRDHPVHSFWESGLTCEAELTPNCIVNVEQTGTNDYWGILHKFPLNEILLARIYDLETMLRKIMEKEKQTGKQHYILYIMDLSGLHFDSNLMTMLRGALRSISTFMTENYIELFKSFVLVNAPEFISMLWTIAKPLLPEKTRLKVVIMGASHWRKEILEIATPKSLPSFWNQNCEDKHIPGPTYVPISGKQKCEFGGVYRLYFSNEHSWFHVLKVRYRMWSNVNEEEN
ncbi:CRAL-TRIO domain-containing protein [Meloidogyne graminicola]|uniref:CRAL-TRIO domain-containing protein n=1 Tax=Meloidogyne graminicola TaxID=189291 RepID=A0A8S9ZQA6_9BILA|nr:CRAL-TRIO domain-containing protein [Meloidogyne graminicola]